VQPSSRYHFTASLKATKWLAKGGGRLPQMDYQTSYEAKMETKCHNNEQWKILYPKFHAEDGHFQLS
jgi:hypothetical protein